MAIFPCYSEVINYHFFIACLMVLNQRIHYYLFFLVIYDLVEVEHPSVSHFSMAKSFHTMGCFLNKVASSSLVSAFLAVRGFRPEKLYSPHSLVSILRPTVAHSLLIHYPSIIKKCIHHTNHISFDCI